MEENTSCFSFDYLSDGTTIHTYLESHELWHRDRRSIIAKTIKPTASASRIDRSPRILYIGMDKWKVANIFLHFIKGRALITRLTFCWSNSKHG